MGNAAAAAAQQQAMAHQQQAMMAQQQQMMLQQQQAMARMGAASPAAANVMSAAMPDDKKSAECMGLSLEEYHLMMDPPAYPESKAHMKARAAVEKKVDHAKLQACQIQAGNQMMGEVQGAMAGTEQKIAQSRAAGVTEAPGQTIELANDLVGELRKGKTAARNIDWVAGSGDVSEAGKPAFDEAMGRLAAALRTTTASQFRLDLYMDQRYDETAVSMFGPPRLAVVQGALTSAGVGSAVVLMGKAKRDKNPRLEIVKVK
jgi:hypothetical protein